MKYLIKANFQHNDDLTRENFTFYDEEFQTREEAQNWLDENYDLLADGCAIDCKIEEDLQGFYLDDIVIYEEETK